ncbi:DUF4175 family protein [Aestuariibaculum suncheonense]|uniref:Liver stage antigen n=1 Tax=Aestuariibaculum suncheonense TaxID=1028745 RepID=A0A8J6Q9H4_9FLAO|nr:DUF4175 family protein [Aestuariibaculum suncheonense]MBD0836708.1 hypothetical protein [Aestuariibaculum suncheonense]
MTNFNNIQEKLEGFIKRYYFNELLKGIILFFAIGLLYFLGTLLVEYMLWLSTRARTILFWLFITVEIGLLTKFIVWPLTKLFKLQKGIDYEQASKIIGTHFPEVKDKLLNVLQLHQNGDKSELLLASIEQKSLELSPIPFKLAVNFKSNLHYLKYAAIPLVIFLAVSLTGNFNWFSDSYKRVVHYKTAYEPPSPFQFFVLNDNLNALEDKDFKLLVRTSGSLTPENAEIRYNDEMYYLQQTGVGEFEYVFSKPKSDITFELQANGVTSKPYTLQLIEVPSLLDFQMVLDYPAYTNKQDEILKSTGNAIVPEGTRVSWNLKTKSTSEVYLYANDTTLFSKEKDNSFMASKQVFNNFNYNLSTSNAYLRNYENLGFSMDVIKDAYPELNVEMKVDSLDLQTLYFRGQVSDDYGFTKLELVYYPSDDASKIKKVDLNVANSNFDDFMISFPYNVDIQDGVSYELYFQVADNDQVNRYKTVKSNVFSYRKRTVDEETQKNLQEQKETIKDLNKSLKNFEEQEKQLEELSNTQKEKETLNFNDKKKLESFLERQKQQDELMKNFNKKLKDNVENFPQDKKDDAFKEDLKNRLQENEEKLKEDEKLLEELEKFKDKITKEQLANRLEELAKQNKNKKRSLEQLLELTKRFYVQQKLDKLKDDLMKMANDQDKLSEENLENNTKEKQEELNKQFDEFTKELDDLSKESKGLRKPIDIPQDKLEENDIKKEQQNASDALEENQENNSEEEPKQQQDNKAMKQAKESQKKASDKMKKLSEQMQSSMQAGGGEQMQEDVDMLRQILDNLVLFSFDEEALMNQFKGIEEGHSKYASYLKMQNNLREHFEHVDDSLFALSLRQPKLSEQVNKEITEVYYNVDKALSYFAEGQIYQGISNQQFTVTAANNLANFLSSVLDNMEEQLNMSQSSSGQGEMQLPDIIMSQEQLNEMMQEGMKKSEEGQPKDEEGEGDQKDNQGEKEGEKGKDGKSGESGEMNQDGEGNNEELNGMLYEIYQRQQELRNALEDRLAKEGRNANSDRLVRNMEQIEMDLLNKGFTNQTLQKMMNLKHQLLKMENATFQQGEDNKRESETNNKSFQNTINNKLPDVKQYFNTTEILNKQTLPLQPDYKKKVQVYFRQNHD